MDKENKNQRDEVRITGVPKSVHDDLRAIANNSGVTLSQFLRPKLREIVAEYPDIMKIKD